MITQNSKDDFSGRLISLDQGNQEVSLSDMTVDDGKVTMRFADAGAEFVGQFDKQAKQTVGKWKQGGDEYDLTIKPVDQ